MEKETWYFTFGSGQQHSNCFVVIDGTREETMEEMTRRFGQKWSMQYSEQAFKGQAEEYGLKEIR